MASSIPPPHYDAQALLDTFRRFVSPQVVERLLADPGGVRLGGSLQTATVLFADLRGFTALAEQLRPELLVEVLNGHLTVAAQAVLAAEGTISQYSGDQIMALFNAPLAQPDHAVRAAQAALDIRRQIAAHHTHLPAALRMEVGVGMVTGEVVVGHIGAHEMLSYTAIGDAVNLAERLQELALGGEILVSEGVRRALGGRARLEPRGLTAIRGRSQPEPVYVLLGLSEPRESKEPDGTGNSPADEEREA